MSYRIITMLFIAILILVAGMIYIPASSGQQADTIMISAASNMMFEGLLAVKEADGVFIVRSEDGKKKRFKLNKNTRVIRNGKPAAYRDLRSRDQVLVHYNSNFVVTEIQASGP